MADLVNADSPEGFADAFGNALNQFLRDRGMRQSDVVEQLGLDKKTGRARISSYCSAGKRPKPDAEILYLVCSKLPGFYFDYKGYRISAATLNGNGAKPLGKATEQLTLAFDRQFNLTDEQGSVTVRVKRPHGRIEVSLFLKAKSS
jgi:transcriptional regulator with XRE-family HTH domain